MNERLHHNNPHRAGGQLCGYKPQSVGSNPTVGIHIETLSGVLPGQRLACIVTSRAKSAMEDYFDYHPELEACLLKAGKHDEVTLVRSMADLANIQFVRQKETLGLGHAIWRAKSFVGQEHFAILLGDDIMRSDIPITRQLIDVAKAYGTSVVGVQPVSMEDISKYSNLKVTHLTDRIYDVEQIVEKPKPEQAYSDYAVLGRYVLSPVIFDILKTSRWGMAEKFN